LLGHLDKSELADLIRLVELARSRCGDTQAPVSCSGDRCSEDETEAAKLEG